MFAFCAVAKTLLERNTSSGVQSTAISCVKDTFGEQKTTAHDWDTDHTANLQGTLHFVVHIALKKN